MNFNILYVSAISVALIGECYAYDLVDEQQAALWSNNLRIISCILMGIWFYKLQSYEFRFRQKFFTLSLLLPILVSLSTYLIPEPQAIIVNLGVNISIFIIWIYYFHQLGAKICFQDSDNNFKKIIPAFLFFPLLFYFFSLYESLTRIYSIIVFIYVIIFSYTGILAVFIPLTDKRRMYVIFGFSLLVMANIMNAYHTFLEKLFWAYPVIRIIAVASKCMFIYGIAQCSIKNLSSNKVAADV
ncbi:MAG: hypothetical protein ACOVO2_17280 [Emticicia sp.]|uniref:hypothetical protein n=1 Tax=Emticicia sp. TaxID=1930953 RepID=UPI003BA7E5FE